MIKLKNSVFKLVNNKKFNINCVKLEDAIKIHSKKINLFIDLRNVREVQKYESVLGSKYLLKDTLKFWVDCNSVCNKEIFKENFNFIFYYASDWRSVLATITGNNINLLSTSNLISSFRK